MTQKEIVEAASETITSLFPLGICAQRPSYEIVHDLLIHLYNHEHPVHIFALTANIIAYLPHNADFELKWRSFRPAHPPTDPYDINDPEGLHFPSVTGSPQRLPSYHRHPPTQPPELLILAALSIAARYISPSHRPTDSTYWTLGVSGGRFSHAQFIGAVRILDSEFEEEEEEGGGREIDQEYLQNRVDEFVAWAEWGRGWEDGEIEYDPVVSSVLDQGFF